MNRRRRIGMKLLLTCLSASLLLCSCQATPAQEKQPDREEILRQVHRTSATLTSSTTQFDYQFKTTSRLFTVEESSQGTYLYHYDSNRSLIGAMGDVKSNQGHEELLWLPSQGYIRLNDGSWESSTQYPDQRYALLQAYSVFSKIENKLDLIPVANHPDLVEFYYETATLHGLQALAELGPINLQQLPIQGLKGHAHFYVQKSTGQIQQVDVQIAEEAQEENLARLQLLFYQVNEPVRLEAPTVNPNLSVENDPNSVHLDLGARWNALSTLLQAHQTGSSYKILSDFRYTYNVHYQRLRGHKVDRLQMVKNNGGGYFVRGDRRIENDRVDEAQEVFWNARGRYSTQQGEWVRDGEGIPQDPAATLLYDLLSLNQGLTASSANGRTVYSYSGSNPLFFVLCAHLYQVDLSELRNQKVQIDLDLTVKEEAQEIEQFRLQIKSPYNDNIDLNCRLQFLNYGEEAQVEPPDVTNSPNRSLPYPQANGQGSPDSGVNAQPDGPGPEVGDFKPAPEHLKPKQSDRRDP